MKTTALIGSTGLIGSHILDLLLKDESFESIWLLVRRPVPFDHPKANIIVLDFDDENAFSEGIAGFHAIFRPSMLLGKRNESRPAESIAQTISKPLSFLFPSKYIPIAAADVAQAMVAAGKQNHPGFRIYHYREMMSPLA